MKNLYHLLSAKLAPCLPVFPTETSCGEAAFALDSKIRSATEILTRSSSSQGQVPVFAYQGISGSGKSELILGFERFARLYSAHLGYIRFPSALLSRRRLEANLDAILKKLQSDQHVLGVNKTLGINYVANSYGSFLGKYVAEKLQSANNDNVSISLDLAAAAFLLEAQATKLPDEWTGGMSQFSVGSTGHVAVFLLIDEVRATDHQPSDLESAGLFQWEDSHTTPKPSFPVLISDDLSELSDCPDTVYTLFSKQLGRFFDHLANVNDRTIYAWIIAGRRFFPVKFDSTGNGYAASNRTVLFHELAFPLTAEVTRLDPRVRGVQPASIPDHALCTANKCIVAFCNEKLDSALAEYPGFQALVDDELYQRIRSTLVCAATLGPTKPQMLLDSLASSFHSGDLSVEHRSVCDLLSKCLSSVAHDDALGSFELACQNLTAEMRARLCAKMAFACMSGTAVSVRQCYTRWMLESGIFIPIAAAVHLPANQTKPYFHPSQLRVQMDPKVLSHILKSELRFPDELVQTLFADCFKQVSYSGSKSEYGHLFENCEVARMKLSLMLLFVALGKQALPSDTPALSNLLQLGDRQFGSGRDLSHKLGGKAIASVIVYPMINCKTFRAATFQQLFSYQCDGLPRTANSGNSSMDPASLLLEDRPGVHVFFVPCQGSHGLDSLLIIRDQLDIFFVGIEYKSSLQSSCSNSLNPAGKLRLFSGIVAEFKRFVTCPDDASQSASDDAPTEPLAKVQRLSERAVNVIPAYAFRTFNVSIASTDDATFPVYVRSCCPTDMLSLSAHGAFPTPFYAHDSCTAGATAGIVRDGSSRLFARNPCCFEPY